MTISETGNTSKRILMQDYNSHYGSIEILDIQLVEFIKKSKIGKKLYNRIYDYFVESLGDIDLFIPTHSIDL